MPLEPTATGTWKGHGQTDIPALSASSFVAFAPYLIGLLLILGAGSFSVLAGPDNNWDLRYYHLYAPWAYLHDRYLYDVGPAQFQGFFNPASDFLFYGLISSPLNEFPRVIAFIMGAVHGINAVLVLLIANHVIRPQRDRERIALRAIALIMGISGMGFVSLLGLTTNDLFNSLFILGSLLCVLKAEDGPGSRLAWAGLLAGIAVGLKYTAAVFMPGLGLLVVLVAIRRRMLGGAVGFAIATVFGILVVAGPHLFMMWRDFGNPLFPLFNEVFQSPAYDAAPIRDDRFVPNDFWQFIAYPLYWARYNHYLVSELAMRDVRGAIAYVTIVAAAIRFMVAPRKATPQTRGLGLVVAFAVISFFCWETCFGIYRYGVVLEMLTGIIVVGLLLWIFESTRVRSRIAAVVLLLALATTIYPDWGHRPYTDRYIDVEVPKLPPNSIVLVATWEPVAYFIPYADPSTRFLGIENNYLEISQTNGLASEVKRLMRSPGPAKFVLNVSETDPQKLNGLLQRFGLKLGDSPCLPIRSNLEVHVLSLCPVSP